MTHQPHAQGPGDAAFFDAATWRYEGGRVSLRDFRTDGGTTKSYRTSFDTDDLGYLTSLAVVYDPGGAGQSVFSETQVVDAEGNVTEKHYAKIGGRLGDKFDLDGHDRVQTSWLGVNGWGGEPDFDKKLVYALDLAQNRTHVTTKVTTPQGIETTETGYAVDSSSNRYTTIGGLYLAYDRNGNLIFDGYRFYVYDYLDRLCEVWDWVEGMSAASASSSTSYRSRSWPKAPLTLSSYEIKDEIARLHLKDQSALARQPGGIAAYNKALAAARSSSQTQTSYSFALTALYGYDPLNRRVFRATVSDGVRWTTWDGWQLTEEYEQSGTSFTVKRVFFDGLGLDEHLGYAVYDGSSWTRYTYAQDSLGHVMRVMDASGQPKEAAEYDAYGARSLWTWTGSQWSAISDTQVQNPYGYTGRWHDRETDLVYMRNRYLDPGMGRFVTSDTIGDWADPPNWGNGYAYGGNAPATGTDPLGTFMLYGGGESPSHGFMGRLGGGTGGSSGPGDFVLFSGGQDKQGERPGDEVPTADEGRKWRETACSQAWHYRRTRALKILNSFEVKDDQGRTVRAERVGMLPPDLDPNTASGVDIAKALGAGSERTDTVVKRLEDASKTSKRVWKGETAGTIVVDTLSGDIYILPEPEGPQKEKGARRKATKTAAEKAESVPGCGFRFRCAASWHTHETLQSEPSPEDIEVAQARPEILINNRGSEIKTGKPLAPIVDVLPKGESTPVRLLPEEGKEP